MIETSYFIKRVFHFEGVRSITMLHKHTINCYDTVFFMKSGMGSEIMEAWSFKQTKENSDIIIKGYSTVQHACPR